MDTNLNTDGNIFVPAPSLTAEVDVLKFVNLALMQNGFPVMRDLLLANVTDEPLRDVVCTFSSEDGLIVPGQMALGEIRPRETIGRRNVDVILNQRRIMEVRTDSVVSSIRMSVAVAGVVVCEQSYPVTILTADQWLGIRPYSELLAAYVLPNAELVCRLQAEAAREIERATGSSSLEGYQSGKKRALEICAAIYAAIQKLSISYSNPPASFGQPGQKIRLPDAIEKYKLATCLETSLLMAAVMERCELYPVLVLVTGHCYVGCHLVGEPFADVVTWDAQTLRKRADLDEFVAIETTKMTSDASFNVAEKIGRSHLDEDETFICAIDVVRSRESGIRPLSLGGGLDSDYVSAGRSVAAAANGDVRDLQESVDLSTLKQAQTTQTRIDRWTQKLLDFSARNRLLNIPRASRQVIRLMCSKVGDLEDKIAADKTITIRSIADSMGEKALDDLLNGRMTKDQCTNIIDAELSHQRLCVMMPPREVVKRLTDLLHDARTNLEESGVNTLFLTIGELQWMEPGTGAGRKAYRAPILMVPVRLERASMAEGVKMVRLDEDTTLNTTLIEFLRVQFNLVLPGLEPLPTDDYGVDVPLVLQVFRQTVKEMEGWEVFDDATVGCYSFGKFVMWKDMTDRVEDLRKSPLVNHLIGGGGLFDDGVEVFPADEVAKHLKPDDLFCPVSYDSSQLAAVLYSEMGKTFVLHGPPGTGKSQTITNIIAHNLAHGRRVLFVSEKKAALDVVKERLDGIGLAPFCLELHSNKTEKGKFYGQIKAALDVPETALPGEWGQVVADFEKCRLELNAYIEALHHAYPNGMTAYNCFSRAIQYGSHSHPELLGFDCLSQSREAYRDARESVQDLLVAFRGVSEDALVSTPELKTDAWSPVMERRLRSAAEEAADAADALFGPLKDVYGSLGLSDDWSLDTVRTLMDLLSLIKGEGKVSRRFHERCGRTTPALLSGLLEMRAKREACAQSLGAYRLDRLGELDYDGLASRIAENDRAFFLVRFFKNAALVRELGGIVRLGAPKLTVAKLSADLPAMREYADIGKAFQEKAGCGADDLVDMEAALRDGGRIALERWPTFREKYDRLLEFVGDDAFDADLRNLGESCRSLVENIGDLRNVLRYRKAKTRADGLGVGAFADYIVKNDDGALDVLGLFDDSYAAKMLEAILTGTPVLAEFTGLGQDERIAHFRDLDRRCTSLSRKVIFAKLAAALSQRRRGPCPENSDLGKLKRECEKKSRQKAVRQILAECGGQILRLKPCFLMSPLSVAQYLPVDAAFDLIVFDEASQIPVWDAIGVIARGRQLIVVGDPKQMPPTNFFQKGDIENLEEEAGEELEDQESILDECLVAGVYSTYLNWHYRSRHESLIAFSNEHYYSNRLCTFPAAASSPRLGVKFVFVPDGRFTRTGKGPRVNVVEAKALVDYVCTEVLKPDYRKRSIGIVTFSLPQQKLILEMLEERREQNAVLEKLLPDEGEGAYFVKNLENVQGDESDVILFSVGYAPDENGRFTMNFGPLNISGGERRLNVAITRAREQVIVFSSIHGSQIDAGEDGRTHAVGATHLKAFLEYAERGGSSSVAGKAGGGKNGNFGDAVAAFLEEKGYQVDRDVGCGDYRVDIAVRDPDDSGKYLMGIECDGPSYAGQRTAQDRDVNRPGVLRGLGWRTCRVWSVDWAFDRARSEQHLLDVLEEARNASEALVTDEPAAEAQKAGEPASDGASETVEAGVQETVAKRCHPEYRVWKSNSIMLHDYFYEPSSRPQIARMMGDVIAAEGPVCEAVLRKRVCKAWGLTRMTDHVHRVFDACTPSGFAVTEHGTGKVYWPHGVDPASWRDYRVPSEDPDSRRALEEIPPEELMNAMCEILSDLGGCHQDDLYRETIKLFGLSTLTAKARKFLDAAFAILAQSGMI